jgi:hypothetical protein
METRVGVPNSKASSFAEFTPTFHFRLKGELFLRILGPWKFQKSMTSPAQYDSHWLKTSARAM